MIELKKLKLVDLIDYKLLYCMVEKGVRRNHDNEFAN
jgi:hypothetical protein